MSTAVGNGNGQLYGPRDHRQRAHEFSRGSLIGHSFRIQRTYGVSVLGVRIYLAYQRAFGCRDSLLEKLVMQPGLRPFDNVHGIRCRVRRFAAGERELREINGRRASRRSFEVVGNG